MKLFPAHLRTSTFAVRMHKTSPIKLEGTLSFQHPLRRIKAVIHLQAKPSCLWGCTTCRAALSVWGHFSSLGFCYALLGGVFFLFLCWVLVGSQVPGAAPAQGSELGSDARLMSPSLQPMAVTSWAMARDIRAGYSTLLAGEPPERSGVCWWGAGCPRQDGLSAQPRVLLERPRGAVQWAKHACHTSVLSGRHPLPLLVEVLDTLNSSEAILPVQQQWQALCAAGEAISCGSRSLQQRPSHGCHEQGTAWSRVTQHCSASDIPPGLGGDRKCPWLRGCELCTPTTQHSEINAQPGSSTA